jgi:hypothetical protein
MLLHTTIACFTTRSQIQVRDTTVILSLKDCSILLDIGVDLVLVTPLDPENQYLYFIFVAEE